jgi:hypothetical protein
VINAVYIKRLKVNVMIAQSHALIEVFADIPDSRKSRGKRHPLSAILALSCCAMLGGARSYSAIADWGRNYGAAIAQALGFPTNRPVPPPYTPSLGN